MYGPAVTEADHLTTVLANDTRGGIEKIEKTTAFICGSLPTIIDQLTRLGVEHGDRQAAHMLTRLEDALAVLSAVAVNQTVTDSIN